MSIMKEGDILFDATIPGSTRDRVALFSEATEDPNPIHVDPEFAKAAGFPQVIQQGPMTTAHFGMLLAKAVGARNLKVLDVSFTAPVFPEEALRMTGTVAKVEDDVTVDLVSQKQDGTVTAKGFAIVAKG
jgi:acyl dehydratase